MASPEVQHSLDEANQILESANRPGVGTTLRYLRICKALVSLRGVEGRCSSKIDLGCVRMAMLPVQCLAIDSICLNGLCSQDHAEMMYRIDETLATWVWLFANAEFEDADCTDSFRQSLSTAIFDMISTETSANLLVKVQSKLQEVRRNCSDPFLLALLFEVSFEILHEGFHQAIRMYEAGRWANAMSLLRSREGELDVLVEQEEKLESIEEDFSDWGLGDGFSFDRAEILRADYAMHLAICQGSQLMHSGDLHFKEALNGEAEELMARALLAQDDYRAALILVTDQDVELEGALLTRLARFQAKINKIPVTAHQLYLRAVQLAAALQPALPKGDWYSESVAAVQAHRDALQAEEAKKWEHARKPILEKLSKEMEELQGAKNKSDIDFIKFIFTTWPPKTDGPQEVSCDPEDPNVITKKILLKVIQRYHVDKNMSWGDEWRVLSEEISKELTARYNIMKGV